MKPRIKSMIWDLGSKIQLIRTRRKENPKQIEDSISSLWDNFKCSSIRIIGVPEGEEKEQEIRNLFEKIMEENFPNLEKIIDTQVQETQSPKQDGCKEAHSKTHHN